MSIVSSGGIARAIWRASFKELRAAEAVRMFERIETHMPT